MRKAATKFAWILSLAISLFFVGPQFGSLDTDGDGFPDVPIMVMQANNGQNVQPTQSGRQVRIALGVAQPFPHLQCHDSGPMKGRIAADLRSAGLDSVTPLRC